MKWRFSIDPRNDVGYVRSDHKVGCSFAGEEICVIYGDEEREKRGHMIASAPELLAALKAFRDDIDGGGLSADHRDCIRFEREGVGDNCDMETVDQRCYICRAADDAIAKAEGR